MIHKLADLAEVIRSKNSGPYELTFDVIFKDEAAYQLVAEAGVINPQSFAELYGLSEKEVIGVVNFPLAKAVKITIARPLPSGSLGETDVYGAQQHGPLLNFQFDL